MHVAMQKYQKNKKKGVKDGQVSQQLKQWVHRCPPPIYIYKKREREKGKIRKKERIKIAHVFLRKVLRRE